ncbi:MAG: PD-(D/E)XK nuclease family protein, partial [Bdellovibrionota bacterium]
LGSEFAVRSGAQLREARTTVLRQWLSLADEVVFLDAEYDPDGREREQILPALKEIGMLADFEARAEGDAPELPRACGAHGRWLAGYSSTRKLPPLELKLPPIPPKEGQSIPSLSASALDAYSRCGFLGLAFHRWKLRDLDETDVEIRADARGKILHEAIRILLSTRDDDGQLTVTIGDALEQAWRKIPPEGLLRGARIESYAKQRMSAILGAFVEKEREYFDRARPKTLFLDDKTFELAYPEFTVRGKPDRVDEGPDGLFIQDYKSSSALPNGAEMLELGYRLQLPFYALSAKRELGKEVAGVQFVKLTKDAGRTSGVFFKKFNGKEAGRFTAFRANTKSLLAMEPADVWARFEEELRSAARDYIAGKYAAHPKKRDKDCPKCQVADLCGLRRIVQEAGEAEVSAKDGD